MGRQSQVRVTRRSDSVEYLSGVAKRAFIGHKAIVDAAEGSSLGAEARSLSPAPDFDLRLQKFRLQLVLKYHLALI